ncbi:MAG TPA: hypothetical protein PLT51_00220 [Candidatus Dojkabacteria bacterium]|jgi:hypothetical protein|nr:hypothetical protein [Candidatus Dojkabacteria bacterium]
MLNSAILIKVKQRLNKLSSNDYDNIEDWQIIEAFDKGQVDWCRRNLHGLNVVKEGDEQSTRRIDDLQILLSQIPLNMNNKKTYYESVNFPPDYLQWKRVSASATSDCCSDPKPMVIYLAEVANVDELLRDKHKQPSFEWGETFCVMSDNNVKIYTNGLFKPVNVSLFYYRQPRRIQIAGVQDPYTGLPAATDVISEFKDDLVELFIDEAVKILAGDIESMNQFQRMTQSTEQNN